nr:DUF3578 domain-containing protein [uncultured Brevundimonas sp.]
MRDTILEIIRLQPKWTADNTPEMERRGRLVRHALRDDLLEHRDDLAEALGPYGEDLSAGGRDGTGRKALVPWTRVFSKRLSPSPQEGWYVVYLFHPGGTGVSLCLSHGSTTFEGGEFRSRSAQEAESLMSWAAGFVGTDVASRLGVEPGLKLGTADLAAAYEQTTVCSRFYPAAAVPDDHALMSDLLWFSGLLRRLYVAQDAGATPSETGPEVKQALDQSERIASPLKQRGQGFGLNAAARKAVELHAMGAAREWLKAQGFSFQDVSATDSCDFRAERAGEKWVVEVKGTTGGLSSVLVTRNEVALHRKAYPKNVLLVVHGITLAEDGYSTSLGTLVAYDPWAVIEDRLTPVCFEYRL